MHLTMARNGRPSGEAYVVFATVEDAELATKKDKEKMGERWLDIFPATKVCCHPSTRKLATVAGATLALSEVRPGTATSAAAAIPATLYALFLANLVEIRTTPLKTTHYHSLPHYHSTTTPKGEVYAATQSAGGGAAPSAKGTGVGLALVEETVGHSVLRMRGLPFTAVKADIITFFEGFGLEDHDIFFVSDASGRPSGEAFAVFSSEDGAKTALRDKDKKEVQGRWIDLFPTTRIELYNRVGIGAGIKRDDFNDKVCVKMRGLPWSAAVQQVTFVTMCNQFEHCSHCHDLLPLSRS